MQIKIIVLGSLGVGKTSILHKFKTDKFIDSHQTTIAIDYISQIFQVDGTDVKVQFWDTAGQQKYNNIAQQYYRKADGSIIVASCDKSVQQNISEFQKYINMSHERDTQLPNILLLNKQDLINSQYLEELNKSKVDINTLKQKYNVFDFRVVSAKTTSGQEFATLFQRFVRKIMVKKTNQMKQISSFMTNSTVSKAIPASKLEPSMIQPHKSDCC